MELNDAIDGLKALVSCNACQYDIENFVYKYYSTKPLSCLPIDKELVIVRARYNEKFEVFRHISDISYNSNLNKVKMGRANYEGQPVFYASILEGDTDTINTCISEVALNQFDDFNLKEAIFTIGYWVIKKPIMLCNLPFADLSVGNNKFMRNAAVHYQNYIERMILDPIPRQYFFDSLKWMSNIFCEISLPREQHYRITSAFYNAILKINYENNINVDGLIYPSANTAGAGLNIALNKEIVRNNMVQLEWVQMLRMNRQIDNPTQLHFSPCSTRETPDKHGKFCFKHIW